MSGEHSINGFMIACGMTGPLELEVRDSRNGAVQQRVYHQPYVVVGRMAVADLPLDDEAISRRHAYLQVVGGRIYCIDLASRAGVQWDDETYGSGWMGPGRGLKLGPFTIRVRGGVPRDPADSSGGHDLDDEDWPATARGPRTKRPLRASLEFPGHGVSQPPLRIGRKLTLVGRSPLCKVLLSGAEVSRFHCSLVRTSVGVWLVDLLGRKGTIVDGRPVRSGLLADGDTFEVGSHRVRLHYGAIDVPRHRPAVAEPARPPGLRPTWTETAPAADPTATAGLGPAPGPDRAATAPIAFGPLPAPGAGLPLAVPSSSLAMPVWSPPAWSPPDTTIELKTLLEGRPPEHVALAESLLVPLVHQFGRMQAHMFDQFQNMMFMMMQMFSTMHQDQMNLVRTEMAQIRQLTEQLQQAQAELEKQAVPARPPASPPEAAAAGEMGSLAAPRPSAPPPTAASRPATPPAAPAAARAPEPRSAAGKGAAGGAAPTASSAEASRDLHAVLAQRVAKLQEERQTRWQRLIQMVVGQG